MQIRLRTTCDKNVSGTFCFFESEQIEARCYCETLNLCENLFASYLVFWDTGGTFPTPKVATLPGQDPNISEASRDLGENLRIRQSAVEVKLKTL